MGRARALTISLCLATAPLLASCNREAKSAEREYEIAAKSHFGTRDACAAAGRAKDAWLRAGSQQEYELWKLKEYNACSEAERSGI